MINATYGTLKLTGTLKLALGGLVDTDVDCISNDAVSSPTYYQSFSSVFFLLLFTTLRWLRH